MSELKNNRDRRRTLHRNLLTTVAAVALFGAATYAAEAADTGSDRPVLWIEIGGQLDRLDDSEQRIAPPFFSSLVQAGFASPLPLERPPLYSIDETGKVSFEPSGSDWILSVSVRYGRTDGDSYLHQQTNRKLAGLRSLNPTGAHFRYAEDRTVHDVMHAILDFVVGKDVGLGLFGEHSVVGGGVRFAQFHSKSGAGIYADPDYTHTRATAPARKYFHNYNLHEENKASFAGVGPTLSWDASLPLHDGSQSRQISFDWGLNGAVLFGRQKTSGVHQTKGKLSTGLISGTSVKKYYNTKHYTHPHSHNRSRMAAVPDVGAAASLSFRYGAAKISAGYRADLFFCAMDGGIDTRKSENVGFYGPFATVSIGIGG